MQILHLIMPARILSPQRICYLTIPFYCLACICLSSTSFAPYIAGHVLCTWSTGPLCQLPNSPGAQADASHVLHLFPVDAAPLVLQLKSKDAGVMRKQNSSWWCVVGLTFHICDAEQSRDLHISELMVDTNDVSRGMECRTHNAAGVDAVGVPGPPHPAGHRCMPEVVHHQVLRQIFHGLQTWKATCGQALGSTASTNTCQQPSAVFQQQTLMQCITLPTDIGNGGSVAGLLQALQMLTQNIQTHDFNCCLRRHARAAHLQFRLHARRFPVVAGVAAVP